METKSKSNKIQLSDHFTYFKLTRFVLPSIGMMVFTSVYGIVDGLFVSNVVGKTAFASINLVMPVEMIVGAIGFMIGTGGAALVAKTLGEQRKSIFLYAYRRYNDSRNFYMHLSVCVYGEYMFSTRC